MNFDFNLEWVFCYKFFLFNLQLWSGHINKISQFMDNFSNLAAINTGKLKFRI